MGVLGIDNHNWLNVKVLDRSDPWVGTVGYDDRGHVIFSDPVYGLRAAIRTLARKMERGRETLTEIIESYAPRSDGNNPDRYAAFVARRITDKLGKTFTPDMDLDLFLSNRRIKNRHLLRALMESMIEYENFAGFEACPYILRSSMALYERDFC